MNTFPCASTDSDSADNRNRRVIRGYEVPVTSLKSLKSQLLLMHVETADKSAAGCPSCGVASTSVKQYVRTTPRDLPDVG